MRNSLKIAVLILCTICLPFTGNAQQTTGKEDRAFWVENLTRIADPVLVNLSNNTLKKNMPYESLGNRRRFSHLEGPVLSACPVLGRRAFSGGSDSLLGLSSSSFPRFSFRFAAVLFPYARTKSRSASQSLFLS